jgi:hypothetical protein
MANGGGASQLKYWTYSAIGGDVPGRFGGDKCERWPSRTLKSLWPASPAGPTAPSIIVARARSRRRTSLRPALHVRVHDKTDGFVPRRNRSLQHGPASSRPIAGCRFIAIIRIVTQIAELVIGQKFVVKFIIC